MSVVSSSGGGRRGGGDEGAVGRRARRRVLQQQPTEGAGVGRSGALRVEAAARVGPRERALGHARARAGLGDVCAAQAEAVGRGDEAGELGRYLGAHRRVVRGERVDDERVALQPGVVVEIPVGARVHGRQVALKLARARARGAALPAHARPHLGGAQVAQAHVAAVAEGLLARPVRVPLVGKRVVVLVAGRAVGVLGAGRPAEVVAHPQRWVPHRPRADAEREDGHVHERVAPPEPPHERRPAQVVAGERDHRVGEAVDDQREEQHVARLVGVEAEDRRVVKEEEEGEARLSAADVDATDGVRELPPEVDAPLVGGRRRLCGGGRHIGARGAKRVPCNPITTYKPITHERHTSSPWFSCFIYRSTPSHSRVTRRGTKPYTTPDSQAFSPFTEQGPRKFQAKNRAHGQCQQKQSPGMLAIQQYSQYSNTHSSKITPKLLYYLLYYTARPGTCVGSNTAALQPKKNTRCIALYWPNTAAHAIQQYSLTKVAKYRLYADLSW